MASDIIIREASVADAWGLAEMHTASWRESYAGLLPQAMLDELSVESRAISWARVLSHGREAVFLAQDRERIVGVGSCGRQRSESLWRDGFHGEVSALYVLKDWQRLGLGKGLMTAMFDRLSERGADAASLWVLSGNLPARRFYERIGGEILGEAQDRRGGHVLDETAYGWRDLRRLIPR